MASVVRASNNLGWDILRTLHDVDGGFATKGRVLSSLSLGVAITMLAGAADREKRRALSAKLGVQESQDTSHFFGKMLLTLTAAPGDGHGPVAIANAAFVDKTVAVTQNYKEYLAAFDASVVQYPTLAGAVKQINQWVSDQTYGLINDLLTAEMLKLSHIALVNTIAFKGTWEKTFDSKMTRQWPFYVTGAQGAEVQTPVSMMFMNNPSILTYKTDTYTAVRLPYTATEGGPKTSMVAFLPLAGVTVLSIFDQLANAGAFSEGAFRSVKYAKFGFPKFDLESDLSVMDVLEQVGFPIQGSYPEMAEGPNLVSDVLHRALVKVDEQGTTAVAATAVLMTRSMPPKLDSIIFNRTFAFSIVEDETGLALFTGLYSPPL